MIEDFGMANLETLAERATNGMRSYLDADADARGGILRGVAEALVDARAHFFNKDGEPDWKGQTYAYRMFVREVTAHANVPHRERTGLQASVRWHVGAVLRERFDADVLTAIGLQVDSPRERNVKRRAELTAARALIGPGPEILDPDDVVAVAEFVRITLSRIPRRYLDTLDVRDRERVIDAYRPIAARLRDFEGS